MVIIGLTGGFGVGKSTVLAGLRFRGAVSISADEIVSDLYDRDPNLVASIVDLFGDDAVKSGRLDRKWLASRVFSSEESRLAIESLVHPLVRKEISKQFEALTNSEVVVVEIPLLAESRWVGFDLVVSVEAPVDLVLERMASAGWAREDVEARRAVQADDFMRREIADVVVINDGDQTHLDIELDALWERIIALPGRDPSLDLPGPADD